MDILIKKLFRSIVSEFICAILICVAVAIAGSFNLIPNGLLVGKQNVNLAFVLNTIVVLGAFVAIWVIVKLFYMKTEKTFENSNFEKAAKNFHYWSVVRLIVVTVAIAFSIVAYFLTLEDMGIYTAAILLIITLLYCYPSKEKIKSLFIKIKE